MLSYMKKMVFCIREFSNSSYSIKEACCNEMKSTYNMMGQNGKWNISRRNDTRDISLRLLTPHIIKHIAPNCRCAQLSCVQFSCAQLSLRPIVGAQLSGHGLKSINSYNIKHFYFASRVVVDLSSLKLMHSKLVLRGTVFLVHTAPGCGNS